MIVSKQRKRIKELGATVIEYGLLAGLIALVCIAAATFMGQKVSVKYSVVAKQFE